MTNIPRHVSLPAIATQLKQQMLAYQPPDDSTIYSSGDEHIDVPLPLEELTTPAISEQDIRCYTATTGDDSDLHNWRPCRQGEYLVMQHPLMINNFTVALNKKQAVTEFYDDTLLLPEERFVPVKYGSRGEDPSGCYNLERFEDFIPEMRDHYIGVFGFSHDCIIGLRGIQVIYGLYFPYHQDWVDDAAPRQCFFIDQFIHGCSDDYTWQYSHALLRFDFAPEITDLLRRQKDQLVFAHHRSNIKKFIGFNQTYSSCYIIAESPEIEYNHI